MAGSVVTRHRVLSDSEQRGKRRADDVDAAAGEVAGQGLDVGRAVGQRRLGAGLHGDLDEREGAAGLFAAGLPLEEAAEI